jgi:carboxyl-terminal processing protease
LKTTVQQLDTLLKLKDEMNVSYLPQDKERFTADKDRSERYNQWLKNLSKDIYLDQAIKVIEDIHTQKNLVKSGEARKEEGLKAF